MFLWFSALGIQSPKLRMVSWNLSTMQFGGDWTPQSTADKVIGSLGQGFHMWNPFQRRSTSPSASKTSEQKGEETSRVRADSSQQSPRQSVIVHVIFGALVVVGNPRFCLQKRQFSVLGRSFFGSSWPLPRNYPQHVRDKSPKWKYKKEEEAGKKDPEKEKARSRESR